MLEDKIEQLIGAIEGLTDAINSGGDLQAADNAKVQNIEEQKAAIGAAEAEMHKEPPAPAPAPVSKKKTSKKKVSKKKAAKKKAVKSAAKPAITIEQVRDVLVNLERTDAKAVLAEFNVTKLSELSPADFDDAITEAQAYINEEADDLDI